MENKVFKLESSALSHDLIFENGEIAVSMIRKLKSCRIDQVTKVVQKQTSLSGGDEISFRIYFNENGKEQKFPWVQALVTASSTKECLDYMKQNLPASVIWIDERELKQNAADGRKVFDLQFLPFGYAGAGLPRGVQLWIYLIALAVLIVPLILIGKILATGGYRIYCDDHGIELKKLGSKRFSWSDIAHINLTHVTVVNQDNTGSGRVLKMTLQTKTGGNANWVMRYDHAIPLMKIMSEHQLISEETLKKFA